MSRSGVLVIGSANMDMVVNVEKFPKPGETIFGTAFNTFPGGKGANQAVACAVLGGETFFVGKMGDDSFKQQLNESMINAGVNMDNLLISGNGATGMALITVESSGENEIVVVSGSNMELSPKDIAENEMLFEKVKLVVCQLEIPLESVIKASELAQNNGAQFMLNPAPGQKLPDELLANTDYIIPNETELELITGAKIEDDDSVFELAGKLLEKGVKNVLVTVGARGVFVLNSEMKKVIPAPVVEAVDTTAAGDTFSGAFAFALSNDYDFEKAVHLAVTAASLAVTKMGAQSSMPDIRMVTSNMKVSVM